MKNKKIAEPHLHAGKNVLLLPDLPLVVRDPPSSMDAWHAKRRTPHLGGVFCTYPIVVHGGDPRT